MTADGRSFRDAGALATGVQALLYADAAFAALAALLIFSGADAAGDAVALFFLAQFVVLVGGAVLFLVWLFRANANARALGADDMMVSPGWAVGWWFVPLANLVMPFVAMRELWKASAAPRDWQMERASASIPFWWGCWILSNLAGVIAFRLELQPELATAPALRVLSLASEVLAIPAALLLARIVAGIQAMQGRAKGAGAAAVFT